MVSPPITHWACACRGKDLRISLKANQTNLRTKGVNLQTKLRTNEANRRNNGARDSTAAAWTRGTPQERPEGLGRA